MDRTASVNSLADEKKFYERFWALLRNRDLMQVFETFGPEVFRRSSVLEGFEAFLNEHEFRGDTCVEIGTFNGLTAVIFSRRFRHVVTIDILDAPIKHDIVSMLGIDNVTFVTVKDNAEKAELIGSLEFDAAYQDGNHEQDTQSDFALLRRCGRVLFHEHWDAQPAVMNLVGGLSHVVAKRKFALWTA